MPGFYIVHITRGSRIGDTSMGIFLRNIGKKIPNGSQSLRSCWYSLEALRQHWLSWEVHVTAELYSQLAHLVPWRVIQPSFEEPCAPRMWIFFFLCVLSCLLFSICLEGGMECQLRAWPRQDVVVGFRRRTADSSAAMLGCFSTTWTERLSTELI